MEILICDDIWFGVFSFFGAAILGLTIAPISDRFDCLVDKHLKTRKWSLGWLLICSGASDWVNGAQIVKIFDNDQRLLLPFPQTPLPKQIIGFQCIRIRYINQRVINFLQRIRRLFDSCAVGTTVYIGTRHDQSRSWHIVGQHVWPLIAKNICGVSLNLHTLDRLRREIAASKTLRWIHSVAKPNWNDAVEASSSEAVSEWLHASRRADGRIPPKVFKIRDYPSEMEQILARHKAAFMNAVNPVNYIICVELYLDPGVIVPFVLTNNWTGELLQFRRINDAVWLLVRCPIVRKEEEAEDKWAKWEMEAISLNWDCPWNRIYIAFNDSDIDLSSILISQFLNGFQIV